NLAPDQTVKSPTRKLEVPLIIRSIADLEAALLSPRVTGLFAHEPLILEIPGLTSHARHFWQNRFSGRIGSCGCGLAAAFALFPGLGVFLLHVGSIATVWIFIDSVLKSAFAAFCFGLAGKLLGLFLAKAKLKRDGLQFISSINGQNR